MPDDDRMPSYLGASWRKVHRCLQGREPVDRTADGVRLIFFEKGTGAYGQERESLRGSPGIGGQLWHGGTAA